MYSPVARTPQIIVALRDALERQGALRWPVEGASMAPTLHPGDEIEIVPLKAGAPRLGDIVVFAQGESLVVHRLVRRRGELWITQGDGCALPDPPATPSQQLGQVRVADADGKRRWPTPLEPLRRYRWVGRYHLFRVRRWLRRVRRTAT